MTFLSNFIHCVFLSLSRFGKKKDEKKEAKAALQRQKSDVLSDHELERMKDERERWGALMMITICMCFKFARILVLSLPFAYQEHV